MAHSEGVFPTGTDAYLGLLTLLGLASHGVKWRNACGGITKFT
jgi:hypothetical protein